MHKPYGGEEKSFLISQEDSQQKDESFCLCILIRVLARGQQKVASLVTIVRFSRSVARKGTVCGSLLGYSVARTNDETGRGRNAVNENNFNVR